MNTKFAWLAAVSIVACAAFQNRPGKDSRMVRCSPKLSTVFRGVRWILRLACVGLLGAG